MQVNVFRPSSVPNTVKKVDVRGLDWEQQQALLKNPAATPFTSYKNNLYFFGPDSQLVGKKASTWSFDSVDPLAQERIVGDAVRKMLLSQGLLPTTGRLLFSPRQAQHVDLLVSSAGDGYFNDAVEYLVTAINNALGLVLLPKLTLTRDGDTWDRQFVRERSPLIANKTDYAFLKDAVERWVGFLDQKLSASYEECGELNFDVASRGSQIQVGYYKEPDIVFHESDDKTASYPLIGLRQHHPYDYNIGNPVGPIKVGYIGTRRSLNSLKSVKDGYQRYPGFQAVYKADLVMGKERVIGLKSDDLQKCQHIDDVGKIYMSALQQFLDNRIETDVIVVELPVELVHFFEGGEKDLRDYLKVKFLQKDRVTQFINPQKFDAVRDDSKYDNLALGIYVKSGGVPWKVEGQSVNSAYIGISFGISKDSKILVGIAEIFDNFGESLSIRGTTQVIDLHGKGLHMSKEGISSVIDDLLKDYESRLGSSPEKLVIHKTTPFDFDEAEGIEGLGIIPEDTNLIYLNDDPPLRMYGDKMPYRGNNWIFDNKALVYTSGLLKSRDMYIGKGQPVPILVTLEKGNQSVEETAEQLMQLTRLNWNSTRNYEKNPVTLSHSKKIVRLLRAGLRPDEIVKDFRFYL